MKSGQSMGMPRAVVGIGNVLWNPLQNYVTPSKTISAGWECRGLVVTGSGRAEGYVLRANGHAGQL